jgi:hypothetical protein
MVSLPLVVGDRDGNERANGQALSPLTPVVNHDGACTWAHAHAGSADVVHVWRHKRSDTKGRGRPVEVDREVDVLDAVDRRILGLLREAGGGRRLRRARSAIDSLSVVVIGSGTSTFQQFDQSLERLQAQNMIRLDENGVASLTRRGRKRARSLAKQPDPC